MFADLTTPENSTRERPGIMLDALYQAIAAFTSFDHGESAFDGAIEAGVLPVAEAAGIDLLCVFHVCAEETKACHLRPVYQWPRTSGGGNLAALSGTPAAERLISLLATGECVCLPSRDFSGEISVFSGPSESKTKLLVPIFLSGKLWGAASFDRFSPESCFDAETVAFLRSVARLFANRILYAEKIRSADASLAAYKKNLSESIHRQKALATQAVEALEGREKMLDVLNQAAFALLMQREQSFEEVMAKGVSLIADIANIDRMSVFRNLERPDGLHLSQSYRWSKETGPDTQTLEALADAPYAAVLPSWRKILAAGKYFTGSVRHAPEIAELSRFGCLSVMIAPIFNGGNYWGFVFFEKLHEEHFTTYETDVLNSASFMLANAVLRNEESKKIREADEYMKLMLEATPMGCTLWDRAHRVIDCNEAALQLFKMKDKQTFKEQFLTRCFPEYQPDGRRSREHLLEIQDQTFAEGRRVLEYMHQTPGGTPFPAEITLVRVKCGDDYVLAGYTRDLSEHKRMTRRIERRNTLLRVVNRMSTILLRSDAAAFAGDLLRVMGILAETADADRVYVYKNHTRDGQLYCSQIYEYVWMERAKPRQDQKCPAEVSYRSELPEWYEAFLARHCVNGAACDMPPQIQNIMTQWGILSLLAVPIFLKETFWGFIGFEDCHQERLFSKNEENILRSASELIADALIRNDLEESLRTAAVQLQDALTGAQSANRAKSAFLSRMSHEMRTPMNAIIGMTAIGKSARAADKKDYAFDKIDNASKHLLGVINDVLDMSKIEADKLELSHDDFIFDKMLQKVVNVVNFRVDERRQSLYINIDREIPPSLIGDEQRLAQIITNLLSNAVKFTPEGGAIHLNAELLSMEDETCRLQISVADTGIGLTEEQKSRVFRSFEQAESNTARQYGGTGLGLSISKRIVELMGGEISVESQLGQGAVFSFTAVLKRGKGAPKRLLGNGVNWSNIRIFAVDDDPEIRAFFLSLSENLGIACDVCGSGEEAARMLEQNNKYNIYFIDWKLPGMNGIELSRLVNEKITADSLVLLFSSIDWSSIEDDARSAGIARFLPKPLFQSDIVDVINESLGLETVTAQDTGSEKVDDLSEYTILLAEDMDINREIVTALLAPTNVTILCAEDGAEALRMFQNAPEKYGLIFMDVQMPVMDGYEATRRIRALDTPRAKKVPIVAMTANVFREDIERCLEAGMNSHIGKPIILEEVLAVLREYLTHD